MKMRIPERLGFLLGASARYKGAYGGRGAGKSWAFADSLIALSMAGEERILCLRELQRSLADSVHQLLCDRIKANDVTGSFDIHDAEIVARQTGSTFRFSGIKNNTADLKSWEGATRAWVEEAEKTSQNSLDILIPTIRRDGSELWFSWNTATEMDPVYTMLVKNPRPDTICVEQNYYDNPWFPDVLRIEMEHDKATDTAKYEHVWLGKPSKAGAFFTSFNPEVMAERPFVIPPHVAERSLYGGFDFGWGRGWASFGLWYLDGTGLPHRLRHWYRTGLGAQEQADDLFDWIGSTVQTSGMFPGTIWYDNGMDVHGANSNQDAAPIDFFKQRWQRGGRQTRWVPANKARVQGWEIVSDYCGRDVDTKAPKMRYWREYNAEWERAMLNVKADPNDPTDVLKSDIDHPCDETRYCLVGLRSRAAAQAVAAHAQGGYDEIMRYAQPGRRGEDLVPAGMADSETGWR